MSLEYCPYCNSAMRVVARTLTQPPPPRPTLTTAIHAVVRTTRRCDHCQLDTVATDGGWFTPSPDAGGQATGSWIEVNPRYEIRAVGDLAVYPKDAP